jgi:hypothetical protein
MAGIAVDERYGCDAAANLQRCGTVSLLLSWLLNRELVERLHMKQSP